MKTYPLRVRLGTIFSQLLHTLIGGHPDQTLSSAAHEKRWTDPRWERVAVIADRLFGPDHCADAFHADCQFAEDILEKRARLEAEYE